MSEEARTGKRFDLELPIKIHGKTGDDSATPVTPLLAFAGVSLIQRMKPRPLASWPFCV